MLARACLTQAEIALRAGRESEAAEEVSRAVEVVREAEAPLAAWQVFATAAELHTRRGREIEAARAWGASAAVLRKLVDSMDEGDVLRASLLGHPSAQRVLEQAAAGISAVVRRD